MKSLKVMGAVLAALLVSTQVFAVSAYDTITAAVDWSDATTALGVIAAALALFLVFKKGARGVLGMIGR